MAVNLRILGASGLVVAGAAAAVLAGQLPAFGRADHVLVSTPSSAAQSLVCPGAAIAVGAEGTDANEFSATGRPARTVGTVSGTKPTTKTLGRGDVSGGAAPRVLTAPAAGSAGSIAGAQSEDAVGDAAGLVATACTVPQSDVWFAAGATTTGRTSVLTLANASTVPAQVRVSIWTENGPVDGSSTSQVTVPAKGRAALSLAGIAPSAGGTVVRVTSTGGRVGAALEQRTVRGLESGGVDMTAPTAAPARAQVVTGVRIAGASAVASAQRADDYADLQPVVRVLVPGTAATTVSITVTPDAGGQPVTLGRRVAAGVVTDFPVSGLVDGTYTVRVVATRPFVTGVRTSTVSDASGPTTPPDTASGSTTGGGSTTSGGSDAGLVGGDGPADASTGSSAASGASSSTSTSRGIDLAWFSAAAPLTATSAVAVTADPSPRLSIANPDRVPRTVRLSGAVDQTVTVPAKGSVAVAAAAAGLIVLRGAEGLSAAVSYAGQDAIAGYPVMAADQQARAVRISQ